MISRRALLAATALAVPSLALGGCAGQSANQALGTVATNTGAIANGLAGILPQLGSVAKIPAATIAKVGAAVADLQKAAAGVAGATTTATAQPLVQQIESDVNAIVGALAAFSALLPPPVPEVLAAATVLLPVVETAVNLAVPPSTAALPPRLAAASVGMTPDEARTILAGAAR